MFEGDPEKARELYHFLQMRDGIWNDCSALATNRGVVDVTVTSIAAELRLRSIISRCRPKLLRYLHIVSAKGTPDSSGPKLVAWEPD